MSADDEFVPSPELSKPHIDPGMYFDPESRQLYIGVAFESGELGPVKWWQEVVTSNNELYSVDNTAWALFDPENPARGHIRRCLPMNLSGLKGKPRLTRDGLGRVLAGAPAPDDLAKRLVAKLKQYVHLTEEWQYYLLAVWLIGTYFYKVFPVYPFLLLMSRLPGSGKTQLLSLAFLLAFNAHRSSTITAAGLRRTANEACGTILLDEAENVGAQRSKNLEIKEAVNSMFDADSTTIINVQVGRSSWAPTEFRLFCPLMIAKLSADAAAPTIVDRSLIIRLRRLKEAEATVNPPHPANDVELAGLRDALYLFGLRRFAEVWDTFTGDSEVQVALNRRGRIWQVILSIAKVALDRSGFEQLRKQALLPEPQTIEEELPNDLLDFDNLFEDCRMKGLAKLKVSDIPQLLGAKLRPDLRGNKTLVAYLRTHQAVLNILVREWGPGRTAYVFIEGAVGTHSTPPPQQSA